MDFKRLSIEEILKLYPGFFAEVAALIVQWRKRRKLAALIKSMNEEQFAEFNLQAETLLRRSAKVGQPLRPTTA